MRGTNSDRNAASSRAQGVVIVMSTKLPSVTGCEATRVLKKDPATHGIRVLIYTGHVSGPHLTWAQRCGCDALLRKPSLPGELESEVARLIAMGAAGPVVPLPNVA